MRKLKERIRDVVDPRRWDQHITEDLEEKWSGEGKSMFHPNNLLPGVLKFPLVLGEALIKNKHKPSRVSVDHGLKSNNKTMSSKKKVKIVKTKKGLLIRGRKKKKVPFRKAPLKRSMPLLKAPTGKRMSGYVPAVTKNYALTSSSPGIRFGSGSKPGCLIVHGMQRIGKLQKETNLNTYQGGIGLGTQSGIAILLDSTTGLFDTVVPFNPNMLCYFNLPLFNFARSFQKFRFLQGSMVFKTALPSSNPGKIMFAYTEDPNYGETRGAGSIGGVFAPANRIAWQEGDFSALENTVSGALWNNFSMKIPFSKQRSAQFYYINNPYGPGNVTNNLFQFGQEGETADDRQSFQGMFYVMGDPGTVGNGGFLGDLYMNYTIELCDMSLPSVQILPSLAFSSLEHKVLKAMRTIEEKKSQREAKLKEMKVDSEVLNSLKRLKEINLNNQMLSSYEIGDSASPFVQELLETNLDDEKSVNKLLDKPVVNDFNKLVINS